MPNAAQCDCRSHLEHCVWPLKRGFVTKQPLAAPVVSSDGSTGSGPCRELCSSTSTEPVPAMVLLRSLITASARLRMAMLVAEATQNRSILTAAPPTAKAVDHQLRSPLHTRYQHGSHRPITVRKRRTTTRRRVAMTAACAAAGGVGGDSGCRYAHMPCADQAY